MAESDPRGNNVSFNRVNICVRLVSFLNILELLDCESWN